MPASGAVLQAVAPRIPRRQQASTDAGVDGAGVDGQASTEASTPPERTIYVPYAKLKEVFEKEGRGVFLPYEQFEKLWQAAQQKPPVPAPGPPVGALITSIASQAAVEQDVVRVTSLLKIELLRGGWNRVPLRLQGSAILSATIDGRAARVVPAADGGYELLVENELATTQAIDLQLVYARAFDKTPGKNSVEFAAPLAPVHRWEIRIPAPGVQVNIDPMIAATQQSQFAAPAVNEELPQDERPPSPDPNVAVSPEADRASNESVLLAFVGAAPRISIDWTPKAEGATGLDALISVKSRQEVFVTEAAVRTRAQLQYEISRSQVSQLSVEVPADHKVINVFDQNVRKWSVAPQGDVQLIQIDLFEPAATSQAITIEMEQFRDASENSGISIASLRAVDVGRQLGTVVLHVDPSLRAEVVARTGLQQLDASELPAELSHQPWSFAYRYAALPFELSLNIEKVQPTIIARQLVEAYLEPEQLNLDISCLFDIAQAGVFQLELDVPAGFEVRQATGQALAGADAVAVDSFDLSPLENDPQRSRLVVNLSRKALGRVGLLLRMHRPINDVNLLTPTGTPTNIILALPQSRQEYVSQSGGNLVLYGPESLRIAPEPTGLRPIAISQAFAEIATSGPGGRATCAGIPIHGPGGRDRSDG